MKRTVRIGDDFSNLRIYEIINKCLNKNLVGWQKASYKVGDDYVMWFPTIQKDNSKPANGNSTFSNSLSEDGMTITEVNHDADGFDSPDQLTIDNTKRVTFGRINNNFKFLGVFKAEAQLGNEHATRINTRIAKGFNFETLQLITDEWAVSSNVSKYDCKAAFRDLNKVNWRQTTNVSAGDIVYVCETSPIRKLVIKARATKVELSKPEIDDSKYNISGQVDDEYNKYMELELAQEFDTELFSYDFLNQYEFVEPQGAIRIKDKAKEYLDIVQHLLSAKEMGPDKHDGSYALVRGVIEEYSKMDDLSMLNYLDLNLVYLMAIGTWKQKVDLKKDTVKKSHLPEESKQRLYDLLDETWAAAQKGLYENMESGVPSIGMFGTGFYSFDGKTTDESAISFIQMCIDIKEMDDDQTIFDRCAITLNKDFKGMQAASSSIVLHCLKPLVFPIFNSNEGSGNIFSYFKVGIKKPGELSHYIDNAKAVRDFRDKYFKVKNYRIFDLAARMINNNDTYWPSDDDYPVNLTKDDWKDFLTKVEYKHIGCMRVLKCYLLENGEASSKDLSNKYGGHPTAYSGSVYNTCKRALKYFNMEPCPDGDNDRYFPIAFYGKGGGDTYVYKMRAALKDALNELDLSDIGLTYTEEGDETVVNEFDKNMILYGPPGTGKTYNTAKYAVAICDGKNLNEFTDYAEVMKRYNELKSEGRVAFTTFHQSYGYEEFIEGIHPETEDDKLTYPIKDGVFKEFCEKAAESQTSSQPFVFIIDEINRGNISKIFGELITLIEDTKRSGMPEAASATLPYSKKEFSVPMNVYLLGTMNTADRSIALMDTALRRRFHFIEMMPDVDVLKDIKITDNSKTLDVSQMLQIMNNRIEYLYDREHTIGHAFFTGLTDKSTVKDLASIFKNKIIPLLQEYFYEDYAKIQLVLGDNGKTDPNLKFILDTDIKPNKVFRGNTSDLDLPEYSYSIQEKAFDNIDSYLEIMGK